MSETSPNPEENPQSKEIYLELGPGLNPSVSDGLDNYSHNKIYIAVDAARDTSTVPGQTANYGEEVRSRTPQIMTEIQQQRPGEHILFTFGEGQHLPLANDSVKDVYAANVLTAPQAETDRQRLLQEVNRVLLPDGELTVKVDWDQDLWNKADVSAILSANGFEPYNVISSIENPLEYQQMEAKRGTSSREAKSASESYFLIARKTPPSQQAELQPGA